MKDMIRRSRDLEVLIAALPTRDGSDERVRGLVVHRGGSDASGWEVGGVTE